MKKGKWFPFCRNFTLEVEDPANRTSLPGWCFVLSPVAVALVRSDQLGRNAVYSGTRSADVASGHRPGRSGLVVYRFAQSDTGGLSAKFAGSQNDRVYRPCVG